MEMKDAGAKILLAVGVLIALGALVLALNGEAVFPQPGSSASLIALFLFGIMVSVHCVGMCGAFAASVSVGVRDNIPLVLYLGSRIAGYTLVGALLGAVGGFFVVSAEMRGAIAVIAGLLMIVYALGLLGVSEARRVFALIPRMPFASVASCEAGKENEGETETHPKPNPIALGLANALMPCGPLQAMQLYALGTGSAFLGALALFAFALGTTPLLGLFGVFTAKLTKNASALVMKASAVVVMLLAVTLVWNGLLAFLPVASAAQSGIVLNASAAEARGIQLIRTEVYSYGYKPASVVVEVGKPVRWVLDVKELTGCNNAVKIPSLGIEKALSRGENVIEFTPTKEGEIEYMCWMGMMRGKIIVTGSAKEKTAAELAVASGAVSSSNIVKGSSCGSGGSCGCGCGG
ncbi:MAG: sulfite exporter TauE/SafE family protein [Candidatus Micrarchaeota archaeon]